MTKEAYREIEVRDGDRKVSIPMAQAIMRSIAVNAAKGQHRSQRLFVEMLRAQEHHDNALKFELLEAAVQYKLFWEDELARRNRQGITHLQEPLPHPDHVRIDPREGTVSIVGPVTEEEKVHWDRLVVARAYFQQQHDELTCKLANETDNEERECLEKDIARVNEFLTMCETKRPG